LISNKPISARVFVIRIHKILSEKTLPQLALLENRALHG